MKDYDLYIRLRSAAAANGVADSLPWLQEWLKKHFGVYTKTMAIHRGIWPTSDMAYDGQVQIYSVPGQRQGCDWRQLATCPRFRLFRPMLCA